MYFNLGEGGSEEFQFGGKEGQIVGILIGGGVIYEEWGVNEHILILLCGLSNLSTTINLRHFYDMFFAQISFIMVIYAKVNSFLWIK